MCTKLKDSVWLSLRTLSIHFLTLISKISRLYSLVTTNSGQRWQQKYILTLLTKTDWYSIHIHNTDAAPIHLSSSCWLVLVGGVQHPLGLTNRLHYCFPGIVPVHLYPEFGLHCWQASENKQNKTKNNNNNNKVTFLHLPKNLLINKPGL